MPWEIEAAQVSRWKGHTRREVGIIRYRMGLPSLPHHDLSGWDESSLVFYFFAEAESGKVRPSCNGSLESILAIILLSVRKPNAAPFRIRQPLGVWPLRMDEVNRRSCCYGESSQLGL